ncbi:glycoside hydrolase family 2 protein [Streptomyces sp. NPDC051684]|uniref:glycoside hydrolase family 2 protein n=1 Tax=Streptomyces sp. NPDC051684 TaxID=3365670 RepID=UPI00378BA7E5
MELTGEGWTLRSAHGAGEIEVPAVVPGCAHTDLMRAGVIADPFLGTNEADAQWVGLADWEYSRRFDVADRPDGSRVHLVFDGLQTIATVLVNGTEVGNTRNMQRRYRFDATDAVRAGANELTVRFASSARAMLEAAGDDPLPYDWSYPYNELRTMACEGGWDWGPTLVTAGIWRDVRLDVWDTARADVDVTTTLDEDLRRGTLVVGLDVEGGPYEAEIAVAGRTERFAIDSTGRRRLAVDVPDPDLWWPRGYGAPTRHDATVRLLGEDGRVLQETHHRVGFRHIAVDTTPDEHGRAFTLRVNGRPVFCKGANWIPDDLFVSRITPARYETRVDQACAANMNTLRVWGGGIYEDEAFYAACDERGVLIWQDFAFACAAYPEEEPLRSEVAAEADDVVRRLAAHPSVVVWNGANECLLGHEDWGWRSRIRDRTWGEGYYRELLPAAVEAHAPGAVYVVNSPAASEPGVHPQVPGDGPTHLWDTWNLLDYAHYRDQIPRFAAEFGWQAPATRATLTEALGTLPERPDDPALLAHQKQPGGERHLVDRLKARFPDPAAIATDTDRWHLATSLNQAHALRTAVEHFRSWWPRTAGALIWQLNDVWPALSWSLIDHGGRPKPAWYAVRGAFADRLVTLQPREAGLSAVLVNDTDEPWTGELVLRRVHVRDGEVARTEKEFTVQARSVLTLPVGPRITQASRRREELVVADTAGADRAVHVFVRDDGVRWPDPDMKCSVERKEDHALVHLSAGAVLGDLIVEAPGVRADTALLTLLPGESATVLLRPEREGSPLPDDGAVRLHTRNDFFAT